MASPTANDILQYKIGGVASGAAALYGNLTSMYQSGVNAVNPYASPESQDAFGDPQYNQGTLVQQVGVHPQGAQGGDYANNIAKGAIAGAAFGGVGAIVGGGIAAIGTALVGGAKKREMDRRHNLAIANLTAANRLYSQRKTQYLEKQESMGDYNNKLNQYDRLNNLYMSQSGQQA